MCSVSTTSDLKHYLIVNIVLLFNLFLRISLSMIMSILLYYGHWRDKRTVHLTFYFAPIVHLTMTIHLYRGVARIFGRGFYNIVAHEACAKKIVTTPTL